ncbi:L10-interacting MYB domain-containing protein-like [Spinacia oleracea]|uniref:L10-interacting MYB domain-containing protein-like n=1 Tax=Spinacia oleracea TaxID=3562 RepID=A0ABM3RRA9_SPIOL|nr:L10-interacting MYB domain-containing protein-like [Spinacia oleracea]
MQPGNLRPPAPSFRPPKKSSVVDKVKNIAGNSLPLPTHPAHNSSNEINDQQLKRAKATWTDQSTKIYCEVCAEEVTAGNRPHTHFNKIGWSNVIKKFYERTGKKFDQKQLKNKWEKLKIEYTAWKNVVDKEAGLGWNHERNTIDAPDDWWEKHVNPIVAKFRYGGIQI